MLRFAYYFSEVAREMLRKGHISPELFLYLMNRSESVLNKRNPQGATAGPLFDTPEKLLDLGALPPGFNMDSLQHFAGYCFDDK